MRFTGDVGEGTSTIQKIRSEAPRVGVSGLMIGNEKMKRGVRSLRSLTGAVFRHLRRAGAAYLVLLFALFFTALAWLYVRESVEAQARSRFDDTTQTAKIAIGRRTEAYIDLLYSTRGLFYASKSVERDEWSRYVNGIRIQKNYEGVQALGYAERVEPGGRESFFRDNGLPGLRPDLSPGGERSVYFP